MSHTTPIDADTLSRLRVDYRRAALDEADIDPDPIRQFQKWLDEAVAARANEPNAMTLATVDAHGNADARMVLLKKVDPAGFAFFTNYSSVKGRQLALHPQAALVFWWPELERQVRIDGSVSLTTAAESDAYFAHRPLESQIGAAASAQSEVIPSRQALEQDAAALRAKYPNGPIPRPENWGGYRIAPSRLEFWQGRPSRLHDRLEYYRPRPGLWQVRRLAP